MKKLPSIMTSGLILLVPVLYMSSCEKNDYLRDSKPSFALKYDIEEMNQEELSIFYKLLEFKQEIDTIHDDQDYVSEKTFSTDSACWYLET
jgi:hypothetical protein